MLRWPKQKPEGSAEWGKGKEKGVESVEEPKQMTNMPVLSPPQLARGCSMSFARMGEDLLKGRPSGRKTRRIRKGIVLSRKALKAPPEMDFLHAPSTCVEKPGSPGSVYSWEPPKLARPSWIWQMHVPLAAEIHKLSGTH